MKKFVTILILTVFFFTAGCMPSLLPLPLANAFFVIKPNKPIPTPKPIQPVKPVKPIIPVPLQPIR